METKTKISDSQKGRGNSFYGRKHSPETIQKMKEARRGNGNGNWKGGIVKHREGYIYKHSPEHPHADHKGYVFEHRLVAEEKIGRVLSPEEVVHHINGVKDDNRPENLQVYGAASEHHKFHRSE